MQTKVYFQYAEAPPMFIMHNMINLNPILRKDHAEEILLKKNGRLLPVLTIFFLILQEIEMQFVNKN